MARVIEQAGVSVAPTGSTGVQVNEFEAAIKSVTSSTTVGAVFVYDTRNDSDGGAWRKKCAGLSWFDETLNTTTRGGRREFPSVALIVADNVTNDTISIYDLDDVSAPLWMQISAGSSSTAALRNADISSIYALNGRVQIGSQAGLFRVSFVDDTINQIFSLDRQRDYLGPIGTRGDSLGYGETYAAGGGIVNDTINDVAATVLEGAEIGALGLPIPTVGVATNGGVSVIHPNGSVYDQTDTISSNNQSYDVFWDDKGGLFFGSRGISSASTYLAYERNTLYADKSTSASYAYAPSGATLSNKIIFLGSGGPYINGATKAGDNIAIGSSQGLSLIKHNDGNPDEGMISYHTSDYCTGYMLGDIRGAFLANTKGGDKSVKGNTLTENGSLTAEKVDGASGTADLYAYKGFSSIKYLSRAYDADFDFGTGDFSVMLWIKEASNSTSEYIISRSTSGSSPHPGFYGRVNTDGTTTWFSNDNSTEALITSTQAIDDSTWHQIVFLRRSGRTALFIDGSEVGSSTNAAGNMDNSSAVLEIGRLGVSGSTTNPLTNGSLSLVRISATAPTPTQVKEIYEAERPLFRAGAKCLLAANQVNDLAYDSSTNLLHVASESTSSSKSFRGLEAVESLTSDGSFGLAASKPLDYVAASGGVVVGVGGDTSDADTSGCGVNLPAIDVRGDLNTADSKLPDDGKLHFSGVTTDATQTVIANIPMEELETMTVEAIVTGHSYQSASSNRVFTHIRETFNRNLGGNIQEPGDHYKLENLGTASCDVTLKANTSTNTVQIEVTGVSGQTPATLDRMQWNATVEVQRITERSYER